MKWYTVLTLLAVCTGLVSANVGYPQCFPDQRWNCNKDIDGWAYMFSMSYRYVPTKLSFQNAEAMCADWDEQICEGETLQTGIFSSWPISIINEQENAAAKAAYDLACVKAGELVWTGARSIHAGKGILSYPGGLSGPITTGADMSGDGSCVALNVANGRMSRADCSTELPTICKIYPNKH